VDTQIITISEFFMHFFFTFFTVPIISSKTFPVLLSFHLFSSKLWIFIATLLKKIIGSLSTILNLSSINALFGISSLILASIPNKYKSILKHYFCNFTHSFLITHLLSWIMFLIVILSEIGYSVIFSTFHIVVLTYIDLWVLSKYFPYRLSFHHRRSCLVLLILFVFTWLYILLFCKYSFH
jgi:hypothetical protein